MYEIIVAFLITILAVLVFVEIVHMWGDDTGWFMLKAYFNEDHPGPISDGHELERTGNHGCYNPDDCEFCQQDRKTPCPHCADTGVMVHDAGDVGFSYGVKSVCPHCAAGRGVAAIMAGLAIGGTKGGKK